MPDFSGNDAWPASVAMGVGGGDKVERTILLPYCHTSISLSIGSFGSYGPTSTTWRRPAPGSRPPRHCESKDSIFRLRVYLRQGYTHFMRNLLRSRWERPAT